MRHFVMATMVVASAAFAMPALADDHDEEEDFLELFQGYLDISEQYLELASRSEGAVFFAIEGIAEIYEGRGEQAAAIPELEKVLEMYPENQAVRNMVRFKLRDLYEETGQADLALSQLGVVLEENR